MTGQHRESATAVEPYFDRTPQPFGNGPPDPLVYDASPRCQRLTSSAFSIAIVVTDGAFPPGGG